MLCIELLLDAVGLVTGILVIRKSQDNLLQKSWGLLSTSLALLLLYDNIEWICIFSRMYSGLPCFTVLLIEHLSLWHIVRTVVFFQVFSLFPLASLRPGWLTPARTLCLCIPILLIICVAVCYTLFNGEITRLDSFRDIVLYSGNLDVKMRLVLFIVSVIAPSTNFLFPVLRRWFPFRRKMAKGLYFYMIAYGVIMSGYIWLMLGTSGLSFNLFGYLVILPAIYMNYSYLRDENPLSLPPSPDEVDAVSDAGALAEIEVSPAVMDLSQRMELYMKDRMPFIHADFSLKDMLTDLHSNEHRLNKALRYAGFSGFRDYVNFHRLQHFKRMAAENRSLTVKELMFGSGFTSRSSFYRYFSNVEEILPTEYLDRLKREK